MRYQQISSAGQYPYPSMDIPVSEKNADWVMAYAKASYFDWSFAYPKGVFYNNGGDYEKFRMYALGKQPILPYKKWLGVEEQTDNTWLSVDWTIRPIVSRYRDRAIARLMKQSHSIVATPIDMLAKAELDQYYAQLKAKLAVKQLMEQQNPELAQHPIISLESGEPLDVEELEMRIENGEQFNRSKDAELAIEVGFYENEHEQVRQTIFEDLFDYGVAGYKDWLGDENKAKFRRVDPECVITNFCRKKNFSDMVHAGEVIDVSLVDLALVKDEKGAPKFDEKQLQEFAGTIAGKWDNPTILGKGTGWYKPYDKFKCKVLDLEFYSYNEYTYSDRLTKEGNPVFRMEKPGRGKADNDRYVRKRVKVVYKVKWIVGTDYVYDWGLVENMKRPQNPKLKAQTTLSYKFYAYNFYEMKAQGFMERLVPYLDDYQLTTLRIQNWKNRAVPSGWWIDLDALENVALNKGGKNMQPKELLQMFFESGILLGRSKDAAGNPMGPNWKPIIPVENSALSELATLYQDLLNTIQQIEATTGYNAITAGDPNPKTLVPGYEMANISTDDALYALSFAERYLSEKLAEDTLCRMQQGLRKGDVSGYARSLNTNTITFLSLSADIALREYGIKLEERTSDDQRMWLMQQMQQDIANGFLDTSDAIQIINTHNAKQAQQILAFRVKKSKQALQMQEMQKIQEANKGNVEVAQAAEAGRQQTLAMELQSKERIRMMELQAEVKMKEMEIMGKLQMNTETAGAKVNSAVITADAKVESAEIAAHATMNKPTSSSN
jgi:hypothetical protein